MKTRIKIKDITPWDKNPRSISKENFEKLKASIVEDPMMLEARPLMINQKNGKNILYGGNMRLKAMVELGWEEAPCHVFKDETDEKMIKRAFIDNMEYGEWSHDLIGKFFSKEDILGMHLPTMDTSSLFNFDKIKFRVPDEKMDPEKVENEIPPLDDEDDIFVKPGDIYQLGDHILYCGDSTTDLTKIFKKGEKARMVFTDPPYGVSYSGAKDKDGEKWEVIKNYDLRGDALYQMLLGAFKNIEKHTVESPAVYICYASNNHIQFESAIMEAKLRVRQQLIWAKHMVLGHSDYHWAHEPILYCSKEKSAEVWNSDRSRTTQLTKIKTLEELDKMKKEEIFEILKEIWSSSTILAVKKDPSGDYIHPTQKPVALPEMCIKNSSYPEDVVFEPFCGSGSTLIACEKTGRKCRACELDPQYVQQIIKRFHRYTFQTVPIKCLNRDFDLQALIEEPLE